MTMLGFFSCITRTFSMKWSTLNGHFGQADHVHALAVVALGQSGGSGQPAGVAAHDLHHGDVLGAVNGGVTDDLLHHHADVLGSRAVAGGVVGDHQVVVDGLGHAHKADVALDACAVICQLADGVHGVVAADVEEVADVQLLQDGEQLLVHSLIGRASRAACSGSCPGSWTACA